MGVPAPVRGPSPTAAVEVFGLDDDIVGYRRSPSDVVRLILFSLATVALLVLTRWAEGTVLAIQSDVVALFGRLDSSVEHTLNQTLAIAAGIMSAAEHFPGLGAATQSPDEGLASVGLSLPQLRKRDLVPFAAAIGAGVPAIVISNASYSTDDFVTPATLSRAVSTVVSFSLPLPHGRRWPRSCKLFLSRKPIRADSIAS